MRPSFLVVSLLLLHSSLHAAATEPAALAAVERHKSALSATKAGVDQDDHLWFWSVAANRVTSISAAGELLTSGTLPPAISVDADRRRGIAMLADDGSTLKIVAWDGRVLESIPLPSPAGDVAWLDGSLVAVTPYFADHKVAVWDPAARTLVRTVGPALPIGRGPGSHLARATLVRYDPRRNEIAALDATFGTLEVFGHAGTLLRSARVSPSAPVQEWLSRDRPEAGETKTMVIWRYPSMSIAPDGTILIGLASEPRGIVTLYAATVDGAGRVIHINGAPCMSAASVAWQDAVVLFAPEYSNEKRCAALVDLASALEGRSSTATPLTPYDGRASRRPFLTLMPDASCETTGPIEVALSKPCTCAQIVCVPLEGWTLTDPCVVTDTECVRTCTWKRNC